MTITEQYSTAHRGFATVAERAGVTPFGVRMIVALYDHDGTATTDELAVWLEAEASMIRRVVHELYRHGLATGDGVDGGKRRPGVRTRVRLTVAGRAVAIDFCSELAGVTS